MPAGGIDYVKRSMLLSYEEMYRLVNLLSEHGVGKLRITGGEPFVRKDLMKFLASISGLKNLKKISITSNGVFLGEYLPGLKDLGINSINLSLDSLDRKRFNEITRRDDFEKVMDTFHALIDLDFMVKINMVVMEGVNEHEINPMAELAMRYPISVRFIEEMPFNGGSGRQPTLRWNHVKIKESLHQHFGKLVPVASEKDSTAERFRAEDMPGDLGIIAAYSRTFCGTCNRIRIGATGGFRTCLYGPEVLNFRDFMRSGHSDDALIEAFKKVIEKRARNGLQAEKLAKEKSTSMSILGG
jgi:molybdenum cofactor biosynthesis protein A